MTYIIYDDNTHVFNCFLTVDLHITCLSDAAGVWRSALREEGEEGGAGLVSAARRGEILTRAQRNAGRILKHIWGELMRESNCYSYILTNE